MWKTSADAPVKTYKLATVTYGTVSAPFLATRTSRALADEEKAEFPDTQQIEGVLSYTNGCQIAPELLKDLSASSYVFVKEFLHLAMGVDCLNIQNEVKRSTEFLAKIAQLSEFKAEIDALKKGKGVSKTSKLKALDPFLDKNSFTLRVGGRLCNADLPFEAKHQIIIL
ncbi:speckle-type POZ protein-like B [Trichonephila clavipes]|nr:speckle-type POZ protein-like B [Trichonephila clavipes]